MLVRIQVQRWKTTSLHCQHAQSRRVLLRRTQRCQVLSNLITTALKLFSNRFKLDDSSNEQKKIITQQKELNLPAVVNGLDVGSGLHVVRSAKAKARKPSVWVSLSPSVDAFSGVLVGLWVWLVLPGSAGADLYETFRLRDHLGAATWAQEQRNRHKVRKSTFVYLQWFASPCEAVAIVELSIPEGKNILWKKKNLEAELSLQHIASP